MRSGPYLDSHRRQPGTVHSSKPVDYPTKGLRQAPVHPVSRVRVIHIVKYHTTVFSSPHDLQHFTRPLVAYLHVIASSRKLFFRRHDRIRIVWRLLRLLKLLNWIDGGLQTIDAGKCKVDGERRIDLDGCADIDLGWTPATNTIPIRRLDFEGRNAATIRAAWFKWSELQFIATDQTYTRTGKTTWQYASGNFSAELLVDDHGVVLRYGNPPIWREEVAGSEGDSPPG